MRGLFVGLGGRTKWVSSATTFTSFVFKVSGELSNNEIEKKYINIFIEFIRSTTEVTS